MNRPKRVPLSGFEKTAILMNVLGEDRAYELMKGMKDSDVRRLLNVMGQLKKAPINLINAVMREYLYKLQEREEIIFDDNLSDLDRVQKGLGEERSKQIFGTNKNVNLVERTHMTVLEKMDNKQMARYLVQEHPQTISIVLAHMDTDKQMAMLKLFPDTIRTEVILRLANLEPVNPDRIEDLDKVMKKDLDAIGATQDALFGGVTAIAEMINNLDNKTMNSIMTRLEEKDPLLAEEIRQNMFTFTDVVNIDDRGIQLVLREVPQEKLLLAMKSAPDELKERIFSSMSERASEMLREDLNAMGPQKVSDVEGAQREIVKIIRRLEEEGKIVIGLGEDSEVVA